MGIALFAMGVVAVVAPGLMAVVTVRPAAALVPVAVFVVAVMAPMPVPVSVPVPVSMPVAIALPVVVAVAAVVPVLAMASVIAVSVVAVALRLVRSKRLLKRIEPVHVFCREVLGQHAIDGRASGEGLVMQGASYVRPEELWSVELWWGRSQTSGGRSRGPGAFRFRSLGKTPQTRRDTNRCLFSPSPRIRPHESVHTKGQG